MTRAGRRSRLALQRGAIDRASDDVSSAVSDAEAVFVAAPVGVLPELTAAALAAVPEDCVVTDVGSTKRAIVAALDAGGRASGGRESQFVGGHPLAGAETSGVRHARADLFDGATWYLTPTSSTSGILYERLHRLLTGIGARPTAIDPETHDTLLATVSHLPHVLANVLVAQAAQDTRRRAASGCPRPARASATPPASPARRARSGPTSTSRTATRSRRGSTTRSPG